MKIELKNVKHSEFASRETDCFQASVYIDGKKAGTVENDGQGGCNHYNPWKLADTLNAYAKTLPPDVYEYQGETHTLEQDADILIGDLLNKHLRHKREKALCRNKTLFRIPGEKYKEGEWNVVPQPFSDFLKEKIIQKYGNVQILNEQVGA
jgi:hypothetical protein